MKIITITALLASILPPVTTYFIIPCDGPLAVERSDPILFPGTVSPHLHTVFGGNGFNSTMTYDTARRSTCTSCKVAQDRSNYWVPQVFYKAKDGSYHPVKNNGARVYYLQRYSSPEEHARLKAFPRGFRMVAGDPSLRTYTATREQDAITFTCLRYAGGDVAGTAEQSSIHEVNACPDGLRAQVFFPSCWNGKDLDSADHKSHMAYPDPGSGVCPPTHPARFMSLFYEIFFDIGPWKDMWYDPKQHPFVLSNGDRTGYSFHVNGWDTGVLEAAIKDCDDDKAQGDLMQCRPFALLDPEITSDCVTDARIDEQVDGWMPKLPGCNPPSPTCTDTATIGPPKRYDVDVSAKKWKYVGCALDNLTDRFLPLRYAKDDMTVDKCIDYCVSQKYSHAGLEYANECYCGDSIARERLGYHMCRLPCAGNPQQYCGGPRRLSVYKKD